MILALAIIAFTVGLSSTFVLIAGVIFASGAPEREAARAEARLEALRAREAQRAQGQARFRCEVRERQAPAPVLSRRPR